MANGSNKTGENDPNAITLGVLSAIEEDDRATQRAISQELGIALGLANAYLKRCVKKGFIKVETQYQGKKEGFNLVRFHVKQKSKLKSKLQIASKAQHL